MEQTMPRVFRNPVTYLGLIFFLCSILMYRHMQCEQNQNRIIYDRNNLAISYHRDMPLIFIGGMPRSGTTLMRAMLDAHPDVRCGEETHVIPLLLGMRKNWKEPERRKLFLEAGIDDNVIQSALSAFILEIIALHGEGAKYLCNKDPLTHLHSVYLKKVFPNAKFIYMIRDGRATVHSLISRKVSVSGFDLRDYRQCLSKWSLHSEVMYTQCLQVGQDSCLPVYYEQLILHPEIWLKRIIKFLGIPWNESVLHHEDFVEKPGGIAVSKREASTDQIIKPVNLEALNKWVGHIPEDVVTDMAKIAPMLSTFGYNPNSNPPNYGKADPRVTNNTLHIQQNAEFWMKRENEVMQRDKPAKWLQEDL
ncbi:protein-tyrosine sulfotransferase 1-like [Mercenaria mercenaria]|uniref:protein-tyrosine sulfotransferase 1-like n=1 Tax=Mercenaria mercenaria TaxID=6596 RepID=UPI00234F2C98|nr:protein-tyrosine sulfotransferase 1-like [Mercenaria mercenaria]